MTATAPGSGSLSSERAPAPRFSLIVPVHNVRAYLRQCLDSILDQSFADFEVVAINDASPDGSGEILDEYAARDSRMHVVHLDENVGLGRARDIGVDRATGQYLLFIDSDDELTPGALHAMHSRIAEVGELDILIFDYARTYWNGRITRNLLAASLAAAGTGVFRAQEHRELLELLMVVWNKAYRREFVLEHGFRFPPGYYEDLPWTYPTMLAAKRIAVLDRICYHYRQRRHGNILRSQNRKHFDVFQQYALVFDFIEAHSELHEWRPFMFQRMLDHVQLILRSPDRVSKALRPEFFAEAAEFYRRHEPTGYVPPQGPAGMRISAIARDDYLSFRLAVAGGAVARRGKARANEIRKTNSKRVVSGKRALLNAYYKRCLRKPIDENLAVYAAYWHEAYACNPAAIYEEAKRMAPQIRGVWVIRKSHVHVIPKGVEYVEFSSPEYWDLMARAKYFINNVNFADGLVKRPGTVHLQTQHGTPLKKMGLDLQEYPVGAAGMNFTKLLERCDRWDYLLSSNRFSTQVWERAYPCDYVMLETGYPRNDRLVRATPDDVAKLRKKLKLPANKTVLLYAPTFRDWSRRGGFDPVIDLVDLGERLGDSYVLLVRAHYFSGNTERLTALAEAGIVRDVSEYPVTEDLMIASDALITDYSSIMFDYANLDRPIIIHAEDWDTYKRVRGVNFDLLRTPPGLVVDSQEALVDGILSGRYRDSDAAQARAEFHKRFNEFDDGYAAERVVRRVFLGEHPLDGSHDLRGTGFDQGDAEPEADDAEVMHE